MFAAVRIDVGATAFARTPFFRSSLAIDRMSVTTPVFATAYADLLAPVEPGMAASEAKSTIAPFAMRSIGRNARVVR